jgi:hypothetical protein
MWQNLTNNPGPLTLDRTATASRRGHRLLTAYDRRAGIEPISAQTGHLRLGGHHDDSGPIDLPRGSELVGEPLCGVDIEAAASETCRYGSDAEAGQVQSRHTRGFLQFRKRPEDRVFAIAACRATSSSRRPNAEPIGITRASIFAGSMVVEGNPVTG